MADTFSTYAGRQVVGAKVSVPATKGYEYEISAQNSYLEGLGKLIGAGKDFVAEYGKAINERNLRNADTSISKLFRERRQQVLTTVKGEDADGLIDKEQEWLNTEKEKFIQSTKAPADQANKLWAAHAERYLDRTGAYQVEQQNIADKNSRIEHSNSLIASLSTTAIGDVGALDEVMQGIDNTFPNDKAQALVLQKEALMNSMHSWALENPSATLNWFKKNEGAIAEKYGRHFDDIQGVMRQAKNQIKADASHAQAMATHARVQQQLELKNYQDGQKNSIITGILNGTAKSEDIYTYVNDDRVPAEDKVNVTNFIHALDARDAAGAKAEALEAKAEVTAKQGATLAQNFELLYKTGFITPEMRGQFVSQVGDGTLSVEGFNKLETFNKSIEGRFDEVFNDQLKPAVDFLKNEIAPTSGNFMTGMTDVERTRNSRYNAAVQSLYSALKDMTPTERLKAINISDENSLINQLKTLALDAGKVDEGAQMNMSNVLTPTPSTGIFNGIYANAYTPKPVSTTPAGTTKTTTAKTTKPTTGAAPATKPSLDDILGE